MYLLALSLIILCLQPAFAQEETSRQIRILDKTQYLLRSNLDSLANRVDSFFATERADDEFGRSTLRIRTSYTIRELEKGDNDISYRLNFKIPSLDKKIREGTERIFHRNKEQGSSTSGSEASPPSHSRRDWYFNADLGINASIPPKAILRARLRKNFFFKKWTHRFLEEVTYITEDDGLSEDTSFTSDYPLGRNLLLRVVNSKTWKVLSKQMRTQHGPNIVHQVTERDALNYSLTAHSIINEEGPWYLENYRLSARYRRDLYKSWIYFDIHTGLDFPKKYSFRRNPFTVFQLEALFGS